MPGRPPEKAAELAPEDKRPAAAAGSRVVLFAFFLWLVPVQVADVEYW